MRRLVSAVAAGLALSASAFAAEGLPEPRASFSAEAVIEVGGERIVHKVFHDAGREHQEMLVDGLPQITILRPDLDRAFFIQSGLDHYIELPLDEATLMPSLHDLEDYEVEPLGAGRDGGEPVVKYGLSRGGEEGAVELVAWMTEDGIVMRLEGEIDFEGTPEHVLLLHREVKRGAQDPALFEPDAALAAMQAREKEDQPAEASD